VSFASADKFMRALCRLYVQLDCSLVEINPLVVTKSGELVALDGKITFDDNALFRHKDLVELRDLSEEDPAEVPGQQHRPLVCQARRQHRLPGQRRGPGHEHDGHHQAARRRAGQLPRCRRRRERAAGDRSVPDHPVRSERERRARQHLRRHRPLRRRSPKAIVAASKAVGFSVPLVVRLEGTEVEEGKKILRESGVKLITADDLTDAAKKVVAAVN
jgi:succinyl-CoA synthetase beta subunit